MLPVRELQTLLRQWRRKGLKESALLKVLELYLGLPNYMNERGEYPSHFFYDLSVSLKFRTVAMMLEEVKRSESFGYVPGNNNRMNMDCFFSPLWKETTGLPPVDLPANLQVGSNYIINNKYNIPPSEENTITPSEEGKKFFHEINVNPAEKAEYLEPLIRFFQEQEAGVSREEACSDVVYLVEELLIPHFIAQERFFRMKHSGRLAWLKNLLKSGHGKELMRRAAEAGRQRRVLKQQTVQTETRLKNRPLSPYEWTDPETGTRFYEDAVEGRVTIPANAPPRPSDVSYWNVIQKLWI